MLKIPPNSAVATLFHPNSILGMEGVEQHGGRFATSFANDLQLIYEKLVGINESRIVLTPNQTLTQSQKIIKLSEVSENSRQNAHSTCFEWRGLFDKEIEEINKKLSAGVASPINVESTEIRGHFKNLSTEDRAKGIMEAINSGDHQTVKAVLGGRPYLSGITNEQRDLYTRTYHEKSQPDLSAELKVIIKLRDHLGRAHSMVDEQFEKAVGADLKTVQGLKHQDKLAKAAFKAVAG